MMVIKWIDQIKGPRVKVYGSLCGRLYKKYHGCIVPWSGTDPDSKMNSFTWYKDENYWIFLGDKYNKEFNNWRGPINNCQFRPYNLKKNRKTENTCYKYAGSANFYGIPRERNP